MGLDIFFHKVVKVRNSKNEPLESIKYYNDLNNKRANAYFRKVDFLYHYFQSKLVDECCFVTKADLEDLIERCDKILEGFDFRKKVPYFDSECSLIYKKIDLAKELLPTLDSTIYDRLYFADVENVRYQMKKLLKGFNEDTDVIYVVMSW